MEDRFCQIEVTVRPRSSRNAVLGEYQGRVKIALTAPPVDGQANKALIEYLSDLLAIPKKNISVIRGASNKNKTLRLTGLSESDFTSRLNKILTETRGVRPRRR